MMPVDLRLGSSRLNVTIIPKLIVATWRVQPISADTNRRWFQFRLLKVTYRATRPTLRPAPMTRLTFFR